MKAAIYARLSNESEKSTSTKRQVKECMDYANFKGMTVVGEFIDEGISGYSGKTRPEYDKVMAGLKAGEFDTIIVWKLDRLTRRGIAQIGRVLEVLDECGGRLVSVTENIDTNDNTGVMMIAILSEMARSESANTSLRIKAQKREAREAGKWLSGSNVPWGYVLTDDFKLAHDPATAPHALEVIQRMLNGASTYSEVRRLNGEGVPSPAGKHWTGATLNLWISSPALAGLQVTRDGKKTVLYRSPETGQPVSVGHGLATEAEWRKILELRRLRTTSTTKRGASKSNGSPFAGLTRCALCGRCLTPSEKFWRCKTGYDSGFCDGVMMTTSIFHDEIESLLLNRITSLDFEDPTIIRLAEAWRGEIEPVEDDAAAREHLANIEARLDSLLEDRYKRNRFDGREELFDELFDDLNREIDDVKKKIESRPKTNPHQHYVDFSDPEVLRQAWDAATLMDKRAVARAVIDMVNVKKGRRGPGGNLNRLEVIWRD